MTYIHKSRSRDHFMRSISRRARYFMNLFPNLTITAAREMAWKTVEEYRGVA